MLAVQWAAACMYPQAFIQLAEREPPLFISFLRNCQSLLFYECLVCKAYNLCQKCFAVADEWSFVLI